VKFLVGGREETRKEESNREGDRESTAEQQRTVENTGKRRILSVSSPLVRVSLRELCRLLTEYCAGGKIEKNEMGRACGAYGGGERGAPGSGGET